MNDSEKMPFWRTVVKDFMPSWFASVMGTGIFAITAMFYSSIFPFLKTIAVGLFLLNIGLFVVLVIPWLLRWVLYYEDALNDLRDPILSNFYATMPVGMLVLASDFFLIGKNVMVGTVLWILGAAITIIFSFITPYIMFIGEHVELKHINPAWFIPPVALIVVPIAGSIVLAHTGGTAHQIVFFIDYFSWSAGFFIYLSLLAVCMYRFILHKPLKNTLAPTVWINLGPIGAGTIALISLIKISYPQFLTTFTPLAFLFWGFGVWWVVMAIILTLHYIKKISLPYSMAWWAFTFPLGAYVGATYLLGSMAHNEVVKLFGFGLFLLLAGFWTATLLNTAKGVLNKSVLVRAR